MSDLPTIDLRTPVVAAPGGRGLRDGWGSLVVVLLLATLVAAPASMGIRSLVGRSVTVDVRRDSARRAVVERVMPGVAGLEPGDVIERIEGIPLPAEDEVAPGTEIWNALVQPGPLRVDVRRDGVAELVSAEVGLGRGVAVPLPRGLRMAIHLLALLAHAVLAILAWRLRSVVSGAIWMWGASALLLLMYSILVATQEVLAWTRPFLGEIARGGTPSACAIAPLPALVLAIALLVTWILEDFPERMSRVTMPLRRRELSAVAMAMLGLVVAIILLTLRESIAPAAALKGWYGALLASTGMLACAGLLILLLLLLRAARHASRRLREGRLEPGHLQQARVAFLAVQASLLCLVASMALLAAADVTMDGAMAKPPRWEEAAFWLWRLGLALPALGFVLALRRQGLWQVPRARMLTVVTSFLVVGFGATWLLAGVVLDVVLPASLLGGGTTRALVSAGASGLLVALLRPPLGRVIGRRWFPQIARFEEVVRREAERVAGATDHEAALGLALASLREDLGVAPIGIASGDPRTGVKWMAAEAGRADLDAVVAATASSMAASGEAVVETDEGPLLVVRLGPPDRCAGVLVLGPRRGGLSYHARDRHVLRALSMAATARLLAARAATS